MSRFDYEISVFNTQQGGMQNRVLICHSITFTEKRMSIFCWEPPVITYAHLSQVDRFA